MEEKLNGIITEVLESSGNVLSIEVNEETNLRDDLGLDSFQLAELTVHIEEEFGIDVFEDGLVNTVGEIYKKISDAG